MTDAETMLLKNGITVICRRIYGEPLLQLSDALYQGGIRLIEVTFDQEDPDSLIKTGEAIRALTERHPDMCIGGGTVLTEAQLRTLKDAGGRFAVAPNTNPVLIREAIRMGLCPVPGAMTPSEIVSAHDAGAGIVKLFPMDFLGAGFLRSLRAPLGHIPLFGAGGITPANLEELLRAGLRCAGVSSYLTDAKLLAAGSFGEFTRRAADMTEIFRRVYPEAAT